MRKPKKHRASATLLAQIRKRRIQPEAPKASLAELFLQLITTTYPDDRMAPGITISFLGSHAKPTELRGAWEQGDWYASVVRYPRTGSREVVMAAYGNSISDVMRKLAQKFHSRNSLIMQLGELLRG